MPGALLRLPFAAATVAFVGYWITVLTIYVRYESATESTVAPADRLALRVLSLTLFVVGLLSYSVFEYRFGVDLTVLFPSHHARQPTLDEWRSGVFLRAQLASLIVLVLFDLLFSADLRQSVQLDNLPLFTPVTDSQLLIITVVLAVVNALLLLYALVGPILYPGPRNAADKIN